MREEAGIWGDDLNMDDLNMEYRIRRDDWNMNMGTRRPSPYRMSSDARGGEATDGHERGHERATWRERVF